MPIPAVILAASLSLLPVAAEGAERFAVQGVAPTDVLNVREEPNPESRKVGEIPPDAAGIENLGCGAVVRGRFIRDAEEGVGTRWCRVRFGGTTGFVNARFLKEDEGAAAAPLYSVSADPSGGSAVYRSFLVGHRPAGGRRFEVLTRRIAVGVPVDSPEATTERVATVDCGREPSVTWVNSRRIDLTVTDNPDFRPRAPEMEEHNLWWAVCRGANQKYGG